MGFSTMTLTHPGVRKIYALEKHSSRVEQNIICVKLCAALSVIWVRKLMTTHNALRSWGAWQTNYAKKLGIPSLGGADSRSQREQGGSRGPIYGRSWIRPWRTRAFLPKAMAEADRLSHCDPADEDHFSRELRRVQPPTNQRPTGCCCYLLSPSVRARAHFLCSLPRPTKSPDCDHLRLVTHCTQTATRTRLCSILSNVPLIDHHAGNSCSNFKFHLCVVCQSVAISKISNYLKFNYFELK